MNSKKAKKYNNKIKKLENSDKYKPRIYFTYQRKLGNSLPKSLKNTCDYIDKNIDKSKHKDIFKLYGNLDFNNKQLFNIFSSITVALITGVLVNYIGKVDFSETISSQKEFIGQLVVSLLVGIFMLLPLSFVIIICFGLMASLKKDYINNYDIFIAPYERKKAIERIEKEIGDYKYRKSLE